MPSRSAPSIYAGSLCPLSMNFGHAHGASPTVASIQYPDTEDVIIGEPITLQVAGSIWSGYIVKKTQTEDGNDVQLKVSAVDWRDRLKDFLIFGKINMRESDGRYYHIYPADWENQKYTYITKELEQQDFFAIQAPPQDDVDDNFLVNVGNKSLFSTYTILGYFAKRYSFIWTADAFASEIIKKVYPVNLDWNQGVEVDQAIEDLLRKSGMQFTVIGSSTLHVSLRGFSSNAALKAYVNGSANICTLGAVSGNRGQELNQKGRRVTVIGETNRHEDWFACKIGWNPAWNWEFTYGGWQLAAIFQAFGLTENSKVSEMPAAWHDFTPLASVEFDAGAGNLADRRTRNDLTIREYLETYPYKVYQVSSIAVVDKDNRPQANQVDFAIGGLIDFDAEALTRLADKQNLVDYDPADLTDFTAIPIGIYDMAFRYRPAQNLVSESNSQFFFNATSKKIAWGVNNPFEGQLTLVPKSSGASLEVIEHLKVPEGTPEYLVYIKFSEAQYYIDLALDFLDPKSILPDIIIVQLALSKNIYHSTHGEQGQGLRVREKRVPVRGLRKDYFLEEEVKTLAFNFLRDLKDGGVQPAVAPFGADDIAEQIAAWELFHQAIDSSGSLTFEDTAGTYPDGIIDAVTVSFSVNSLTETIQFSSGLLDKDFPAEIIQLNTSIPRKFEDDIIRDRNEEIAKQGWKENRIQNLQMNMMQGQQHPGGLMAGSYKIGTAFGERNLVRVTMPESVYTAKTYPARRLAILGSGKFVPAMPMPSLNPQMGFPAADNEVAPTVQPYDSYILSHTDYNGMTDREARIAIVGHLRQSIFAVNIIPVDNARIAEVGGSGDLKSEMISDGTCWVECYYDGTDNTGIIQAGEFVVFDTVTGSAVTGINENWKAEEYRVIGIALKDYSDIGVGHIPIKMVPKQQTKIKRGYLAKVSQAFTARNDTGGSFPGTGSVYIQVRDPDTDELTDGEERTVDNWTSIAFTVGLWVWVDVDEEGYEYVVSSDCA